MGRLEMFRTKCAGAGSVTSRGWFVCSATRSQRTRRVVYDRPMPSTESRYIPVVNILAGSVAGVFLTKLVTTNLGGWSYFVFTLATLGTFSLVRDGWSALQRRRLHRYCEVAYEKVAVIFKPEILDPAVPRQPRLLKRTHNGRLMTQQCSWTDLGWAILATST